MWERGREWKRRVWGRNFLAASRIQSHRVYSSVHLILFIGSKAFASVAYLRIWSILWAKDWDDTCRLAICQFLPLKIILVFKPALKTSPCTCYIRLIHLVLTYLNDRFLWHLLWRFKKISKREGLGNVWMLLYLLLLLALCNTYIMKIYIKLLTASHKNIS